MGNTNPPPPLVIGITRKNWEVGVGFIFLMLNLYRGSYWEQQFELEKKRRMSRTIGMKRARAEADYETRRQEARAKRAKYAANRTAINDLNRLVVPGYTRVGGSYARSSNPGEKKYFDLNVSQFTVATAGTFFDSFFEGLAAGTGENQRIGSRITLSSIHAQMKLFADNQTTNTVVATTTRILVWMDRQANGAAPVTKDLLRELTAGGNNPDIYSFRELDNASRFRILADKWVTINPNTQNAALGSQNTTRWVKFHFKVPKTVINFSSTTGALTEIKSTNFGILLISDNALTKAQFRTRVRYFDN